MPAITPADATTLSRLDPAEGSPTRPVQHIADAPSFLEGEGFKVRRATAGIDLAWADPFLMLDHMGAVEYAPGEAKGAPDHPHRGFETVTYMIDGKMRHLDSYGGGGVITDGATQWMTAGSGVVRSEMPTQDLLDGGTVPRLPTRVNLPAAQKWADRDIKTSGRRRGLLASEDAGAVVRLIAGELGAYEVRRHPHADHLRHATSHRGAAATRGDRTSTRSPTSCRVGSVGAEERPIHEGQIAVSDRARR
jgi:redox-sensitive bicupin YhaK (pirin superfamily)